MYYGKHGPFKRTEAGQAMTFENDKVIFYILWLFGAHLLVSSKTKPIILITAQLKSHL